MLDAVGAGAQREDAVLRRDFQRAGNLGVELL